MLWEISFRKLHDCADHRWVGRACELAKVVRGGPLYSVRCRSQEGRGGEALGQQGGMPRKCCSSSPVRVLVPGMACMRRNVLEFEVLSVGGHFTEGLRDSN